MTPPVYTSRLLSVAGLTTTATIAVPGPEAWILRCADVVFHSGATGDFFYIKNDVGGYLWYITTTTTSAEWHQWKGRQAFYSPVNLVIGTSGLVDAELTGYIFQQH